MKTWKIITITTAAVVVAALVLISSVSAMMAPRGFNQYGGYGGMMGGYGYGYNPQQGTAQATTPFYGGGGCHGRGYGYGFTTAPYGSSSAPINITYATTIAKNYVASTGNPDLTVKQVEEYQANFYVQVNEKSTGNGAFELLVDKYNGYIYPEMGPNMIWNNKYGMMSGGFGGMMRGIFGTQTGPLTVTATQATANAQQFLTSNIPETTTGDLTTFSGYYTIEILNGTTPYGMLSVNGYSGQVWFHTWHGAFVQEADVS